MHTRRRLDKESRREEIVRAALGVFATRDPSSIPMDELAKAADASPSLIYHYFGDRRGLALAALSATADELIGRMQTDPSDPAMTQLAAGLEIYLDYLQEHPVSWSALLVASSANDSEVAELAQRVDDHAVWLAARALHSDPVPRTLDLALRGWLAFVKATCLSWIGEGTPDLSVVQTLLAGAFVGSVESAAAADDACRCALAVLER